MTQQWKLKMGRGIHKPGPWGATAAAESLQSCPTLFHPMDCSPLGSAVHGILQARILEWVAIHSSKGSSQPKDWTHISSISCIGRWILYHQHLLESPIRWLPTFHLESEKWRFFLNQRVFNSGISCKYVIFSKVSIKFFPLWYTQKCSCLW